MAKIIGCGNEITNIYYSGYTIERVYACGGELVYGEEPEVTYKLAMYFNDGKVGYLPCDSTSAITQSEVQKNHTITVDGMVYVKNYSAITAVTIGECVKTIGTSAFSGMTNLQRVFSYGINVEIIKQGAFEDCINLENIYVGCSTKTIERYAFYNCSGVTMLNICNGVETIGAFAFYNLSSYDGVVNIPQSVTSIGNSAFYNMSNATRFNVRNTTPPSLSNNNQAFYVGANPTTAPIYVASLSAYRLATGWREYPDNLIQL